MTEIHSATSEREPSRSRDYLELAAVALDFPADEEDGLGYAILDDTDRLSFYARLPLEEMAEVAEARGSKAVVVRLVRARTA